MTSSMVITLCIVVMFQQVYILLMNNQHKEERKDLLNRLMAKNTTEYVELATENPKKDKRSMNPLRDKLRGDGLIIED